MRRNSRTGHLGSRVTKEFLTSIRDRSGNLENYHTNWVRRTGVSEGGAICHSRAILCESLLLFISYDQVDVRNLAGVEHIVRRIIQDERVVRKNPKHGEYSGLEFVLNQTSDVSEWHPQQSSIVGMHRPSGMRRLCWGTLDSIVRNWPTRPSGESNDAARVEGVARRRLSSPSTRCWASGAWWALPTAASRDDANSLRLRRAPLPSAETGSQAGAAAPLSRECDRPELPLQLCLQRASP